MTTNQQLREFNMYLEFKKGTANKFYEVEIRESEDGSAELALRYGRIGTNGRVTKTRHANYLAARATGARKLDAKLKKGYDKVNPLSALASVMQDPTERKTNGYPALVVPLPELHLPEGSTRDRIEKWAQKFLSKVNLVRAAAFDLREGDAYQAQLHSVVKSARAEFARIKKTKAHGPTLERNHQVETAAAVFFNTIRDLTHIYIYWPGTL